MSLKLKIILSLINKDLKLEDVSKEIGFVDIYTADINRPYLTNHVFLLYKRNMNPKFLSIRKKLEKFDNFHSKRNMKIKDELYVLYCFTINKNIDLVRKNALLGLLKDSKEQICKFWNFTDVDITDFILGYSFIADEFKDSFVPEEDFSPIDFISYDEKREALVISASL